MIPDADRRAIARAQPIRPVTCKDLAMEDRTHLSSIARTAKEDRTTPLRLDLYHVLRGGWGFHPARVAFPSVQIRLHIPLPIIPLPRLHPCYLLSAHRPKHIVIVHVQNKAKQLNNAAFRGKLLPCHNPR